ncbi:MAG: ATP-binding cassette domain-containing protein [bacterium]
MINVCGITKRFKDTLALDNISFEVKKGEILGFLGPNAAGKTTTMRILSCFIAPNSGTAQVCGYDVMKQSLIVRENIGYLPENNPLYLDIGVKQFLEFVASIRGVDKKRIEDVGNLCNISPVLTKRIGNLSRGFRQRVALTSVLLHNPPVLILDEPTSGLDPVQIKEIHSLIVELGKEKTILLSTHILSEVEKVCDRVIIINKGKIVASIVIKELAEEKKKLEEIFLEVISEDR